MPINVKKEKFEQLQSEKCRFSFVYWFFRLKCWLRYSFINHPNKRKSLSRKKTVCETNFSLFRLTCWSKRVQNIGSGRNMNNTLNNAFMSDFKMGWNRKKSHEFSQKVCHTSCFIWLVVVASSWWLKGSWQI